MKSSAFALGAFCLATAVDAGQIVTKYFSRQHSTYFGLEATVGGDPAACSGSFTSYSVYGFTDYETKKPTLVLNTWTGDYVACDYYESCCESRILSYSYGSQPLGSDDTFEVKKSSNDATVNVDSTDFPLTECEPTPDGPDDCTTVYISIAVDVAFDCLVKPARSSYTSTYRYCTVDQCYTSSNRSNGINCSTDQGTISGALTIDGTTVDLGASESNVFGSFARDGSFNREIVREA